MHDVVSGRVVSRALPARLRRVLDRDPGAQALVFDGVPRDRAWVRAGVAVVDALPAAAIRVGVVVRNRPSTFAAAVAVAASGRQIVTLSPMLADAALAADVRELRPDVLVGVPEDLARPGLVDAAGPAIVLRAEDGARTPLCGDVAGSPAGGPDAGADTAILMQTSGTTGRPRRIPLSYDRLTAAFAAGGVPLTEEPDATDTAILWASLVHISGLYFALANVAAGRSTALLERFTVSEWSALVRRYRPRTVGLAPVAVRMLLQSDLAPDALAGVTAVSCGTAALDPADAERFAERFGVPVLPVYGATEFAGAIASWTPQLHAEFGAAKRGSAGRARVGIALRVVDPATGSALPATQEGVLEARGAQLPGDGWIRTTDLAVLDADGFLFVRGRTDDAIDRGGFTIVPSVIEDALRAHPHVRDASAVGLPDPRLGQVPVAVATVGDPSVGADELRSWLESRLSRYHLPVRLAVVDELPRTPSLKVDRPAVRALFGVTTEYRKWSG
jgi:long-chain acyl-CoA synthetase